MKPVFVLIFFLFILFPAHALSADTAINDFTVNIKINSDGSVHVTENILYDFGQTERHGIYRDVRYRYKLASGNYRLKFSEIAVTDGQGNPYIFKVSNYGDYKRIKIGDPDKTITGARLYRISYTARRAINYFSEYDELYWSPTGYDWRLPIKQIKTEVELPQSVNESDLKIKCFDGPAAGDKGCLSIRHIYEKLDLVKSIVFISDWQEAGQGQTIVIGLPKEIVSEPTALAKIIKTAKDNAIVFVLLIAVLIAAFFLWQKRTRLKPFSQKNL